MLTEFIGNLACPLDFGQAIVIVAKSIDGAGRLNINLRCSKEKISDIGLQFSVQFRQRMIKRQSKINDEWTPAECEENLFDKSVPLNPISSGDFFIIYIVTGENHFYISINNKPYCKYAYRIPVQEIRTIEIKDHIQAIKQVDHRSIFPYSWPPVQTIDSAKAFTSDCPIPFTPGHVIIIKARVYNNPVNGQFVIHVYEGETKIEQLHFNPRFSERVVVRNAMKSNLEFGPEERDGIFPFVHDQQFCLAIAFTEKEFLFAVDGVYFTAFAYRANDILSYLTGFKITTRNGLRIEVTNVDHVQMADPECDRFEMYTADDVEII